MARVLVEESASFISLMNRVSFSVAMTEKDTDFEELAREMNLEAQETEYFKKTEHPAALNDAVGVVDEVVAQFAVLRSVQPVGKAAQLVHVTFGETPVVLVAIGPRAFDFFALVPVEFGPHLFEVGQESQRLPERFEPRTHRH